MMYDYEEDRMERERAHFDWIPMNDARMTMLRSLRDTCKDCVLCQLGRGHQVAHKESIDPHVFSTMVPSKFMVIGQNPGFEECKQDQPFVGDAGKKFNQEIEKYGLTRNDFYITNIVKCYTPDNRKPEPGEVDKCKLFLLMELEIISPQFVITLGAVPFEILCPDALYAKALGKFTYSELIKKKVYAIYHPSPRNMIVEERKERFDRCVELLCLMMKNLKQTGQVSNT
jgi:uracil-DNA glycosylase family 4